MWYRTTSTFCWTVPVFSQPHVGRCEPHMFHDSTCRFLGAAGTAPDGCANAPVRAHSVTTATVAGVSRLLDMSSLLSQCGRALLPALAVDRLYVLERDVEVVQ